MMALRLSMILAVFAAAGLPATAMASSNDCRLCDPDSSLSKEAEKPEIPVSIDITTRLSFSRTALSGSGQGGQIKVSPKSGSTQINGGLIDLGGYALAGTAIVRGEPGRQIRVDMPSSIRMTSSTGGVIKLRQLQTDLGPAPRLGIDGKLSFSFGGALDVSGSVSGKFRGRIPITAQYE